MRKRTPRPKRPPFRPTPASVVGDGILLFLALYGAVFSFTSAFTAQVYPPLLLAGCALYTAIVVLTWSLPRRWWALPLIGVSFLWCLCLRWLWEWIVLGEISLRCSVVNTFCTSLNLDGFIRPIAQLSESVWIFSATTLVLIVMLPLSLLLGLAILRARSFWLTLWITLPFPLAPVCISVTPAWLPLMAVLLVWCVLGLTSLVKRQNPRGTAKLTLTALPAGALLLALLTAAMPQEHYQRPQWADTALDDVANWATHLDIALFNGNGPFGLWSGGGALSNADGEVDLSNTGPLRFSGRTVLEVETDLRGRIYLRGFSGAVYDGTSWAPLSQEIYDESFQSENDQDNMSYSSVYRPSLQEWQPMNFPALADRSRFPEKQYAKVTVHNVGADPGYVYVPYHILSQPDELGGAAFVNDAYLARMEDVWTHTLYVQPNCDPLSGVELPDDISSPEKAYYYFVCQNYLSIPDSSLNALNQVMDEFLQGFPNYLPDGANNPAYQEYIRLLTAGSAGDETYLHRASILFVAQFIAAYLDNLAEYNPDTPATPEGEDFVSYFLTESHEGYCMHFASAATLMLRYMNIPARYVTGYVTDVPSSGKVNVPDSAAHAWVEIYLEGYGWEPVEVTPAYAGGTPGQSATVESTPTPSATPRPSATAAPQTSAAPTPTPGSAPGTSGQAAKELDMRLILIPLAVVFVILAFPARRALGRSRREKKFRQASTNRAVIAAYLQLKKLERWGSKTPDEIFELAKKAKFSPHTLTESEREEAVSAAHAAAVQVDKTLSWYKRFWCRYVLGLC